MDKKAVAGHLRALATNDERRSKAARLRDVLDDVELALAAGTKRADVLVALQEHGLTMSLSTFETTLKRLRAKRRQPAPPRPTRAPETATATTATLGIHPTSCVEEDRPPSHDPAVLDRIVSTPPDLVLLAKLAKRSRK